MVKYAAKGIWCDICKSQFGKDRNGQWNLRAMRPAWITEISEGVRAKGLSRSLCYSCVKLITNDPNITIEKFTQLHIQGQQYQAKFTQGELIHGL